MKNLFLDTNIAIDLLSKREPFYDAAAILFTLGDRKQVKLYISSLSFSTIYYLLRRQIGAEKAMDVLQRFRMLVHILPVKDTTVDKALNSDFTDFEDAIQYYSAIENGIKVIITRNVKDYKASTVPVITPDEFLKK